MGRGWRRNLQRLIWMIQAEAETIMSERRYLVYDVFTDRALTGNPLLGYNVAFLLSVTSLLGAGPERMVVSGGVLSRTSHS
jgi:hypothetical protein